MLVHFLRTSALFMSILILSIGCSKVDEVYQYIRIEESTCSFYGSDNAPRTIKIEAYPKYETEPSASWIVIGDVTDNSFSITVTDNDTNEERIGNILITAGNASARIRITQLAKGNTSPVYNTYDGYDLGAVMSPNGRYCVCVRHEMLSDENYLSYPVFFDLQTGTKTEIGPLQNELYRLEKPMAVTDQGTAFISTASTNTVGITIDGNIFIPEVPDGWSDSPNVQGVSSDGRIWVGFCYESVGTIKPLMWVDGIPQPLEMPAQSYRGGESTMCMARGVSIDGTIIYGTQWEEITGMVYWKNGVLNKVGKDVYTIEEVLIDNSYGEQVPFNLVSGMYCTAQLTLMSADGRWITGRYIEETLNNGTITTAIYPAFYNTETEKTTIFREYPGYGTATVSNDGKGIITYGSLVPSNGFVVDIESGVVLGDCDDYIKEKFGITVPSCYIIHFTPEEDAVMASMPTEMAGNLITQFSVSPRP